MATVHEPPPKVRDKDEPTLEPTREPFAEDKGKLRSDRIHAILVLLAVIAVFALIVLLAVFSPPPEGVEFQPWIMP